MKLLQKPYKISEYRDILVRESMLQNHGNGLDKRTRLLLLRVADYMKATNYRPSAGDDRYQFSLSLFSDFLETRYAVNIENVPLKEVFGTLNLSKQSIKALKDKYGIAGCKDLVEKQGKLLDNSEELSSTVDMVTRHRLVKLAGFFEKEAYRLSNDPSAKHNQKAVNPLPLFSLEAFETYVQDQGIDYIISKAVKPETLSWQSPALLGTLVQHLSEHYEKSQKEFVVYGPTQVGKTGAKALIATFCKHLHIPCIIITKGVACKKNLVVNLPQRFGIAVCDISQITEKDWNKRSARKYIDAALKGAPIVIPGEPCDAFVLFLVAGSHSLCDFCPLA